MVDGLVWRCAEVGWCVVSAAARARIERRWPKIKTPEAEKMIAAGRVWTKVQAAKPWRPREIGDAMIGEFVARSERVTPTGSYSVITLRTEQGALTVSGVVVSALFDAADPVQDQTVRIVYKGEQTSIAGRVWRDFDLFIATDEEPNPWP